jgi:hypothetical protein
MAARWQILVDSSKGPGAVGGDKLVVRVLLLAVVSGRGREGMG